MKNIAIRTGFLMLAGFVGYFLLMHILGLIGRVELRLFNGVIHLYCIYLAVSRYREAYPESARNPLFGVAVSMMSSAIGVVGFSVFLTIYLNFNDSLMTTIEQSTPLSEYLNPFTASLYIFAEGIAAGVVGSYLISRILEGQTRRV